MRGSVTLVPLKAPQLCTPHPDPNRQNGSPQGAEPVPLLLYSIQGSASEQHPPASPSPQRSGAAGSPPQLPAHLVDVLPAELALGLPRFNQVWETRSTEGCEQVLGPMGLSKMVPDPAPQPEDAAQTSSEYSIFLPCSSPPQPSHHAAFLHPGKVLPAPRLSGVHRTRGFLTPEGIRDTTLGLPSCSPALHRCSTASEE